MSRMATARKQQTLAANRLVYSVCCLHASAVRERRMSAFAEARGDK